MATVGKVRNPWVVIGLSIVTLGIYGLWWQYETFRSMKEFSGEGIGGGWALLWAILFSIVNVFLMPAEVGNLSAARGQEPPVSAVTGFWVLLPIVGGFIWLIRTQGSLNRFWENVAPAPSATPV